MLPLLILMVSFLVFCIINRYAMEQKISLSFFGRLSMSLMLLATGSAHFFRTAVMVESMPGVIPFKEEVVLFTGVVELIFAIGLLSPRFFRLTSIMLIVFLICVLPANIIGSLKRVELGGMENGPLYLWFRIPLQFFFIGWVYYFGVDRKSRSQVLESKNSSAPSIPETE